MGGVSNLPFLWLNAITPYRWDPWPPVSPMCGISSVFFYYYRVRFPHPLKTLCAGSTQRVIEILGVIYEDCSSSDRADHTNHDNTRIGLSNDYPVVVNLRILFAIKTTYCIQTVKFLHAKPKATKRQHQRPYGLRASLLYALIADHQLALFIATGGWVAPLIPVLEMGSHPHHN